MVTLTGCADAEIEIPVQPLPLPQPTEPEVVKPEMHSLAWYTGQVWNERARVEQAEEIIAGCMAFNGFEYEPEVAAGSLSDEVDPQSLLHEAEAVGFGIVAEYLAGQTEVDGVFAGPNAEYYEELAPEKQEAYLEALEGTQENGFEGCRSEAQLFTMNTDPGRVYQDDAFRALVTELNALPDRVAEDERAIAAEAEWASCMNTEGFTGVTEMGAIEAGLRDEFFTGADMSDDERDEFLGREIAAATAEVSCAITVGWYETIQGLETSYDEAFVEEHQTELEALVEKYGV